MRERVVRALNEKEEHLFRWFVTAQRKSCRIIFKVYGARQNALGESEEPGS
jgi:hypothetical protein